MRCAGRNMIRAVVDLTELIRLSMQPLSRSPLMQKWEAGAFIWVTSPDLITEFKRVTSRPNLARRIRSLDGVLPQRAQRTQSLPEFSLRSLR